MLSVNWMPSNENFSHISEPEPDFEQISISEDSFELDSFSSESNEHLQSVTDKIELMDRGEKLE